MAAKKGRCEQILGYLVARGADINIKDKNGVRICHCRGERAMFINDCVCLHSKFKAYGSILQFNCKDMKRMSSTSSPASEILRIVYWYNSNLVHYSIKISEPCCI